MGGADVVSVTIADLEQDWNTTRRELGERERALVDVYLGFLRHVARTCLQRGWKVRFRPNQVVHWGEGGFGALFVLVPAQAERLLRPNLPSEVHFVREASTEYERAEEVTLDTLDRINHRVDPW
jgi:hypothetical protein